MIPAYRCAPGCSTDASIVGARLPGALMAATTRSTRQGRCQTTHVQADAPSCPVGGFARCQIEACGTYGGDPWADGPPATCSRRWAASRSLQGHGSPMSASFLASRIPRSWARADDVAAMLCSS